MDLRVLAAVFLTLFAVAIGMAQGNVDVADVRQGLQGLRSGIDLSNALSQDKNTSSGATLTGTLTSPDRVTLQVQSPARLQFTAGGNTTATVGGSTLRPSTNTSITTAGFQGDIRISPGNVSISGTVTRIATEQLAFTYDKPTAFTTGLAAPRLSLVGLEQQAIRISNATGTVTTDETMIEVDREQAVFDMFAGNLTVDGAAYSLAGTVQGAILGDARVR